MDRLEAIDRRRDQVEPGLVENRHHFLQRVLRFVWMQHLIAEPRHQQRVVGDLRVQLSIPREHLVVGRASGPHLRKVIEKRPSPIEVIQPDQHMATGLDEVFAHVPDRGDAVVGVMEHAERDRQVERVVGLEFEEIANDEFGRQLHRSRDLARPRNRHRIEVQPGDRRLMVIGERIAHPPRAATDVDDPHTWPQQGRQHRVGRGMIGPLDGVDAALDRLPDVERKGLVELEDVRVRE